MSTAQIDLQSVGGGEVAETHQKLAKELALTTAPRDAYKYRRWGQAFDIQWKGHEAFADKLEAGLKKLFAGRRVAVAEASLHTGAGEEEVHGFHELPSFLDYLRNDAKNLTEMHLIAEGPRGQFIGVHISGKLRRMELLGNTAKFKDFRTFQETLREGLKSSEQSGTPVPETPTAGRDSSPSKFAWVPTVTVAILALTGTLLGAEFLKALREAPQLQIVLPRSENGVALVQSPDVSVRWTYTMPQTFGRQRVDSARPALVEVTRIPDGALIIPLQRHAGAVKLTGLMEGSYSVLLTTDDAVESLVLRVTLGQTAARSDLDRSSVTP